MFRQLSMPQLPMQTTNHESIANFPPFRQSLFQNPLIYQQMMFNHQLQNLPLINNHHLGNLLANQQQQILTYEPIDEKDNYYKGKNVK